MKARHHAAALIERTDRVHAAAEADVEVQLALFQAQCMFAQTAQSHVMAGVQGDDVGFVVKGDGKAALQLGSQRLNLRRQPGLCLALGPHQFGAKFGQLGRLAFLPHHQLIAELLLPALELAPDMPVGQSQRPSAAGDGALRRYGLQQINERVAHHGRAAVARQGVMELEPMHWSSYRRTLIEWLR